MDITSFLKKDIVTFLENVSKYGTAENKAVEDEISSLLSSTSSSTDVSSSKKEELKPVTQNINVTIAKEMIEKSIEDVRKGEEKPIEIKKEIPKTQIKKPLMEDKKLIKDEEKPIEKKVKKKELDEIESQILELTDYVNKLNIKETLRLYNHLKLLVLTVSLEKELQNKLYSALKDAAIFLSNNKKTFITPDDKSKKQKDKIDSLENHEKQHEKTSLSTNEGNTFNMPSYVKALKAIKEHDKVTALELLVKLSKQHPKNRAIKMRLREALYL